MVEICAFLLPVISFHHQKKIGESLSGSFGEGLVREERRDGITTKQCFKGRGEVERGERRSAAAATNRFME